MSRPPDVLTSIVESKRLEVVSTKSAVTQSEINDRIQARSPIRGFEKQIRQHVAADRSGIIAECKKTSPSKGVIREDYDAAEIAKSYQEAGASCLSVLTDQKFFHGSVDDLVMARQVCNLPVLRKDFVIDAYQVGESCAIGADCILLIVAVLELAELQEFAIEAGELGLDVLVEVHSREDLEIALQIDQGMIGINNRNLRTFETNLKTSVELCRHVPENRLVISESGIHNADHIAQLKAAGISAFLIGESLMKARDPGLELARIFAAERLDTESEAVSV